MSTIETIALVAGVTAAVEIGGLALLWASFAYRERRAAASAATTGHRASNNPSAATAPVRASITSDGTGRPDAVHASAAAIVAV